VTPGFVFPVGLRPSVTSAKAVGAAYSPIDNRQTALCLSVRR